MLNSRAISRLLRSKVSVFAILASFVTGGAFAAPVGNIPVGLSTDGNTYLEAVDDSTGYYFRLVDTATGSSRIIKSPVYGYNFDSAVLSSKGTYFAGVYYDQVDKIYKLSISSTDGQDGSGYAVPDTFSLSAISDTGVAVGHTYQGQGMVFDHGYLKILADYSRGSQPLAISTAENISRDGTTVVGSFARDVTQNVHAAVWNLASQKFLEVDPGLFNHSVATLVSANGDVVAGQGATISNPQIAFRWTEAGGLIEIPGLNTDSNTVLKSMSADGSVLVGYSLVPGGAHAIRYVAKSDPAAVGTTTDLGTLGGAYSIANFVSSNGNYVVGTSGDSEGARRGFRWTENSGEMLSIEQWLANAGVNVTYETANALSVSDDGNIVVGQTQNEKTYLARVGSGNDSSGIIQEEEFFPTVAAANTIIVQNSVSGANTIMFGAQGNPMRNLLSEGQRSAWGTVDSGYDNNDAAAGGLALGEFGLGYGLADGVTARLSVGGTFTDQDLDKGGSVIQRGFYISPEMSVDVGRDLYLTVGGYWGRSAIDSSRGYLNGGSLDYSSGATDAQTWGAKFRFDWLNAFIVSNTNITPYLGLSYAHTTVDAYTETGGSFPVSYDESKDHSTIARIGADFVHPLSDEVRILAKAEADYQFEDQSAAGTGTLIGINSFTLSGRDLKQFWVRGGVGAEFEVGPGTASVMVNITTQGQDPDVWVRTNYTVKF